MVENTPSLVELSSIDSSWIADVGPVVTTADGQSTAAMHSRVRVNAYVTGGHVGLLFDFTNVTVWFGPPGEQTAAIKEEALRVYITQGPLTEPSPHQQSYSGIPGWAVSGAQPGSVPSGEASRVNGGDASTSSSASQSSNAPAPERDSKANTVISAAVGACLGTPPLLVHACSCRPRGAAD
jgi:hypothetical protein